MRTDAKRILSAVLLTSALLLLPLVQSCGLIKINTAVHTSEPTAEASRTTEEIPPQADETGGYAEKQERFFGDIRAVDYGGADFLVMSSLGKECLFDDGTTVYSSAIAGRNSEVSSRYGVKLAELTVNRQSMLADLLSSVASSSYYADLLVIPEDAVGTFAVSGALMNLKGVPFLDLAAEYFSRQSVEASTYAGRTYAAAGDASLSRDDLSCLYFNKDTAKKLGVGDLYPLVKDGGWTWDRFFEAVRLLDGYYAEQIAAGGEAVYAYSTDPFGSDIADAVFHSSGETYLTANDGSFELSPSLEPGSSLLDRILKLSLADRYAGSDSAVQFSDGRIAFMFDILGTAVRLTDSPTDWGILPIPTSGGRYGTYLAPDKAAMFAIPKGTADSEKSGVIMSALNAASYGVLDEAYVRHALDRVIRDNETATMIDLILSSVVYDPAASLAPAFPAVHDATYGISYKCVGGTAVSEWEYSYIRTACEDELKTVAGR